MVAALGLLIQGLSIHRHAHAVGRFIQGCDSFGYSSMAVAIREGRKTDQATDYFAQDQQTRWLISKFKESGDPTNEWMFVVSAHAFHYFAGSDQVGPQYPAGTGWMLAWFPRHSDVRSLDRFTIQCVVAGGLLLIGWCAWRGLTASCFVMAGAVAACLSPLSWVDMASYSINATILPLFAGATVGWLASRQRDWRLGVALGLVAGCLFGLVVQIRLPSALLVPAMALLFLPRRAWAAGAAFLLGTVLLGVLPILLHNRTVTGSFLGSTYDSHDRAQTWSCIPTNMYFYFVENPRESVLFYVLGLLTVTLIWLAVVRPLRSPGPTSLFQGQGSLLAATFLAGGLSLAYFLTHLVVEGYYLIPSMMLVSLLLGFLFFELETSWQENAAGPEVVRAVQGVLAGAATAALLVGLGFGYPAALKLASEPFQPSEEPLPMSAPPEVLDPRAWIWADRYTSSFVYYLHHPSFRLYWIGPEWRERMFEWVQAKGDPQYMVIDGPEMEKAAAEARANGWRLEPAGIVRDVPCFKVERP